MIIELVGLPGAGKTTFARALQEAGAEIVAVKSRGRLILNALTFLLSYPIVSIRLIDWIFRQSPRNLRYTMFVNGFVVYGANFIEAHRRAKRGDIVLLDQGHAQLVVSLGLLPRSLAQHLPKPDLLIQLNVPDSLRKERMQERGRQPREELGSVAAEEWDQKARQSLQDFNFESFYPRFIQQDGTTSPEETAQRLLETWKLTRTINSHTSTSFPRNVLKILSLTFAAVLTRLGRIGTRKKTEASVLMYHSVGYSGWKHAITPRRFEKQMKHLRRKRSPVPLKHIVRYAKGESGAPLKAVAVTFDDGYHDLLSLALPILKKYQIPATLFLTTDLTADTSPNNLPRLSEDDLQQLLSSGLITIESHGKSHRHFPQLSEGDLNEELIQSADSIQNISGTRPAYFAYPYGDRAPEVEKAVAHAGYEAAFSITEGLIHPGDDLMHLKRIQVDATMNFWMFCTRLTRAVEMNRKIVDRARKPFKR